VCFPAQQLGTKREGSEWTRRSRRLRVVGARPATGIAVRIASGAIAAHLREALPKLVDELTPDGKLPEEVPAS